MKETKTDNWKVATLVAKGISKEEAISNSQIEINSFTSNRCPRCNSTMNLVSLSTQKRQAYFCSNDNVTLPLPIEK